MGDCKQATLRSASAWPSGFSGVKGRVYLEAKNMGIILKLTDHTTKNDFYLEWSTVADAPLSNGMDIVNFIAYYRAKHGSKRLAQLWDRLKRVEDKGTSSYGHDSARSVLAGNRAGENESYLTRKQIIEKYCYNK